MSARTSSGKIITVLSLIIGICGLGIGGYSYYLLQTQITPDINDIEDDVDDLEDEEDVYFEKEVQNTWYDQLIGSVSPPTGGFEPIGGLFVMATINIGESIYVLFNAYVQIQNVLGMQNIQFQIRIGTNTMQPDLIVSYEPGVIFQTATLQASTSSLSAGTYNVTIRVVSSDSSHTINDPTLFVQTYK